jgi:hypothetical protein
MEEPVVHPVVLYSGDVLLHLVVGFVGRGVRNGDDATDFSAESRGSRSELWGY